MGIPFYVASLLKTHKHIARDLIEQDCYDVLAIDFNCFIHTYLKSENPIGSIIVALHEFLGHTVLTRKVYIAFDGLVPYAKMVQQRYRRFRNPEMASSFDKHQISPGTPYMKELADTIRFMFPYVEVSGTDEPGEGEHKIFLWLRDMPATERRRVCIYGLDADLVLISVAQRSLGDLYLMREKQKDEGFSVFSVSALAAALPIPADEFVEMSVLCFGNDFMPNIGIFSLREDGYARALYYKQQSTLEKAAEDEAGLLLKRAKDTDRHILAPDGQAVEARMGIHLFDGVLNWDPVVYAFWKTYAWTLAYFKTSKVPDWEWAYPYPEAPLLSALLEFDRKTKFKWTAPTPTFTIEDQLRFILPEESLKKVGLEPKYPDELYDEEKDTRHRWMKRFVWECDPYVSLPWGQLTSVSETRLAQV
jgi:5'-3' exonuclease